MSLKALRSALLRVYHGRLLRVMDLFAKFTNVNSLEITEAQAHRIKPHMVGGPRMDYNTVSATLGGKETKPTGWEVALPCLGSQSRFTLVGSLFSSCWPATAGPLPM